MFLIAIEIAICVTLGVALIIALIFCNRINPEKSNSETTEKKIDFLPTSINEESWAQVALIAYYEQQRNELLERQKMARQDSSVGITEFQNNDSGYTSVPSLSHTPYSVYECTGFASMDNLEVSNPLFSTDLFCDNNQMSVTSPSTMR